MNEESQLGSMFENLSEPNESYREGCFSFQKWMFDTDSQDVKWIVIRREFLTLNEQAFEWIDRLPFSEPIKWDAKRLIYEIRYDDYKRYHFSSPIVVALCAIKLAFDMKHQNFFSEYEKCIEVIRQGMTGDKWLLGRRLNDASTKERIRFKSKDLLDMIGPKRIEDINRMWGCMDEATLY